MVSGPEFVSYLRDADFDFFTGVPCSLVKSVVAVLETEGPYIPETREDAAVGLAVGAYMAGKKPVVIMQNSGLGVCLNALSSLSLIYGFPCLLLITWRGYEGKDAPEHLIMGDIVLELLTTLKITYRILEPDSIGKSVRWAGERMSVDAAPVALVLPPDVIT